jgi:molybdopterin molybdotransferase
MLTPAEAEALILEHIRPLPAEDCPLAQAHGRILRAPIVAERDFPPFDRVTMDGYALRSAAVQAGHRRFRVQGLQAAGMVPLTVDADDSCVEIATGAVQPAGADAIVPYEQVRRDGAFAQLDATVVVAAGQHLHRRGSDAREGDRLVPVGTRLTGREIAVAASCGCATLTVSQRPSVAVVASGDELVEVNAAVVSPHQIRKSNDYALRAALLETGAASRVERFHLRDLKGELEQQLRRILAEFDVVLLTGGVSKGRFDYVPEVLAGLGVVNVVRGVAQRPGKPLWFGVSSRKTPVFALPGNPVSTYICLHRYVLPALARMAGAPAPKPDYLALGSAATFKSPLAWLLPVVVTAAPDGRRFGEPAPFNTSGDFAGLIGTDGFVELPPGPRDFPAGTVARFYAWS